MTEPSTDAEIARRAARQHGVLSRAQLREAGLDRNRIAYRLKVGRLHRVQPRVYAVGHVSPSPLARAMAAVLACGPGAVVSHRWAGSLWEMLAGWRGPVEVTTRGRHRLGGVRVHQTRALAAGDVTVHFGIPVTTPARTLLDLAEVLDGVALARAFNEARVRRRVGLDELASQLAQAHGRHGAARLAELVKRPSAPTRSVFEDAFLAFLERHRLPRPEVNQRIAGYEVDMLWRGKRLVAELDGRSYHDHGQSFERDRKKDADLLAAGYRVVRITWQRLVHEPEREARRLSKLLRRDSPGLGPAGSAGAGRASA